MEQSRDDRIGKENSAELILLNFVRHPEDRREDEKDERGKGFGFFGVVGEVDYRAEEDWLNESQEGIGKDEDRNEVH